MNIMQDIRPVEDLRTKLDEVLRRVEETQEHVVLTKEGEPAFVLIPAKLYQELQDRLEDLELEIMVKKGMEDLKEGRTRDAESVFEELDQKYGISSKTHSKS